MIWFSENILDMEMQFDRFLNLYRAEPLDKMYPKAALAVQNQVADIMQPFFAAGGIVEMALHHAEGLKHIMMYSHDRAMNSLFCVMKSVSRKILAENDAHPDFPMSPDTLHKYVTRQMINYLMWSLVGDTSNDVRLQLSQMIAASCPVGIELPNMQAGEMLIDYHIPISGPDAGSWTTWASQVPQIEIQAGDPCCVAPVCA
jgi:dynein heavy chain 1